MAKTETEKKVCPDCGKGPYPLAFLDGLHKTQCEAKKPAQTPAEAATKAVDPVAVPDVAPAPKAPWDALYAKVTHDPDGHFVRDLESIRTNIGRPGTHAKLVRTLFFDYEERTTKKPPFSVLEWLMACGLNVDEMAPFRVEIEKAVAAAEAAQALAEKVKKETQEKARKLAEARR